MRETKNKIAGGRRYRQWRARGEKEGTKQRNLERREKERGRERERESGEEEEEEDR